MSFNTNSFLIDSDEGLHFHLINDLNLFEARDKTLNIIDNYYVKKLSDKAKRFYLDSFRNTGINKIVFYFEANINKNDKNIIEDLSRLADEPYNVFLSFITIFYSNSCGKKKFLDKLEALTIDCSDVSNELMNIIDFSKELSNIGIEVKFQPYKSFSSNYIHGRYWINQDIDVKKGYIVDGSLNTYPKGLIIAQVMDDENYNIINSVLNKIKNERKNGFGELDIYDLNRIYNKIQRIKIN